jgi:hypothetical protein
MDSSAVPLKSTDGQDIQQRQATNSGGGIVEEAASTLHPAAAVFRDEILGNIGESNKTLEVNNACFRHLANLIQEVKLAFHTVSSRQEPAFHFHIEHHETFNVQHQLSQGSITAVDDEERLVLHIEDAPAHPVEDCGAIGYVRLCSGGMTFEAFPDSSSYVDDAAKMSVKEDGSVRLTLRLSKEILIKGKLHSSQISNAALTEHVEHPHFMSCLTTPVGSLTARLALNGVEIPGMGRVIQISGAGEYRKGILFTPLSISIQVTPRLKETLALIDRATSSGVKRADVELESEDGLRRLVVEALGDSEHKELFDKYIDLKHENQALNELRSLMLGVTVRHSEGEFTVTLDEGKRLGNFWRINLDASDRPVMPVAELHCMQVSAFGMQLRLRNHSELTQVSSLFDDHDRETFVTLWPMQFQAGGSFKFYFLVGFNWTELTEEEIHDILDNFPVKMTNALVYNPDDENSDTSFPPTFEATLVAICCEPFLAESRLNRAGLL